MRRWNRALTTLVAAAAAGFLVWYAPHFNRWSTGGYWGVIAVLALAGVLIGLSQLHGRDGNPTASFLLAFVPVLVAAGWVILAAEPHGGWIRDHVLSWSRDLGIGHAVHNLGEHVTVLAFAVGAVFGLTFEAKMARRTPKHVTTPPTAEVAVPSPSPVTVDRGAEDAAGNEPAAETQADAEPTAQPATTSAQQVSGDPAAAEEPTVVAPPSHEHEDAEHESAEPPA